MDGTLVDTEPYWIEAETQLVNEHGNGRWTLQHGHQLVGMDLRDSARLIQELGAVKLPVDDIVNYLMDRVIDHMRVHIPWRPGARELLADLNAAGIPCALVTMSWRRFADAVINVLPPDSFVLSITGDECDNGKPHPEPYLRAAQALGVTPGSCVAIEDSVTGLRSAIAAGCRTIGVPNVVELPQSRRYRKVASLADLTIDTLWAPDGRGDHTNQVPRVVDASLPGPQRRPRGPLILTALAVTAGLVGAAWWLRRPDPVPPPPDIPVEAWAPYWTVTGASTAVSSYGSWFREISPFWFESHGTTDLRVSEFADTQDTTAFIDQLRSQGIAITPAFTDQMAAGGMAAVLADPATRTEHVTALVEFVVANDFDGLDIDYEQFAFADPPSTWDATRPNWVAFIAELGSALRSRGLTLSVSVPPPQIYRVYAYDEIDDHVDRIRIMAYDYSVSDPGPIAPLSFVDDTIDAAKELVDDDSKLVLGVPMYGRNWVISTVGNCPESAEGTVTVTHATANELVARRGGTPTRNEATGEAEYTYQLELTDGIASCTQTRRVYWVDQRGVRDRIDRARTEGLGGVSLWALGFDDPATWLAIGELARTTDAEPAPSAVQIDG
jgi:HAD superfamily hydrolase (TIGR01509 family)